MTNTGIKLNLGCGYDILDGYINVDKFPVNSSVINHDLESLPYPWEDNSVTEIVMRHVLEHLGQQPAQYIAILKELYRVCQNEALIRITVPHPNHDNFKNDPTHVRIVTPDGLQLFSKTFNQYCITNKYSNSTLGLYYDIDFEVVDVVEVTQPQWEENNSFNNFIRKSYNNIVEEYKITLKVIKRG
jgi:ubiquinone/menaquinone biosynthesis C-methylase UbiE